MSPKRSASLSIEEAEIEPRVVRDKDALPGEIEEIADGPRAVGRTAQHRIGETCERGDVRWERLARVDECLEGSGRVETS